MKNIEAIKAQKIIDKIQANSFDENDIDNLFMKLRAYSDGYIIFREIADFVAHNNTRNKGLVNSSLQSFYLRMKYFIEFNSNKTNLDISKPFPTWIKTLMIYQVDKCSPIVLKSEFNFTPVSLKDKIISTFRSNGNPNMVIIKKTKLIKPNFLAALNHIMSFISAIPAFAQEDIIYELLEVIKTNNLDIKEDLFIHKSDKIILCIMLLIHNSVYDIEGRALSSCKISVDQSIINPDKPLSEFGNLQLEGEVILNYNGKDMTNCFPIMTTNLIAEEYCDESLVQIYNPSKYHPKLKLLFDDNLFISENFKLSRDTDNA